MNRGRNQTAIWALAAAALCSGWIEQANAQTGACCLRNVSGTCMDNLTDPECCALGGEYRGDNTDCTTLGGGNPANACRGACCLPDGTCNDAQSKVQCDRVGAVNGTFQGYGSSCGTVTCPALDGACCLPSGGCVVTSLTNCRHTPNAFFNGVGTTCATAVCTGGCCLPDGTCQTGLTYNDCCNAPNSGLFQGYDTDCTGANCPSLGACCFTNGTCMDLNAQDCATSGGCYQGSGTDCMTADCSTTLGACLFADGSCQMLSKCDCELLTVYSPVSQTYWVGAGVTCGSLPQTVFLPGGGQVNMAGATLFADYSAIVGATNDFINVDGDIIRTTGEPYNLFRDSNRDCFNDTFDQLAPLYFCQGVGRWWGQWIVQYRSVGSLNGINEFIDFQLLNQTPYQPLTERGVINTVTYSNLGVPTGTPPCPADCHPNMGGDVNGDGDVNGLDIQQLVAGIGGGTVTTPENGDFNEDGMITIDDVLIFLECLINKNCPAVESATPICPTTVDMASTDVPMAWAVKVPGTPAWNAKPTSAGYGSNPITSNTGYPQDLVSLQRNHPVLGSISLNVDVNTPDSNTIFDNTIAISPVAIIANRGTGKENVTYSELQHHFVTGRFPTGENFTAVTRDAGSGTRNACNNALGIDPSWGAGDGIGDQITSNDQTRLGPLYQPTNCGGSGFMEQVVQESRLGIGYTGYFGGSRAVGDANAGLYEILNVKKDVAGATEFVRPTLNNILDNSDVNTGYQVTASQTLATVGDPFGPGNGNPPMTNPAARDYLRNLFGSIQAFSAAPFTDTNATPAQALSIVFVLEAAVDSIPRITDPLDFIPNPNFAQGAQDAVRATNTTVTPAFGSVNAAGRVPRRLTSGLYSDNNPAGNGNYPNNAGAHSIAGASNLFARMRIQGDFNVDGARNWNDIPALMSAVNNPLAFAAADAVGNPGNYIIPEILGDFDGDGNFGDSRRTGNVGMNIITPDEMRDARYFADGLAINPITGKLNRKEGFIRVDNAWNAIHAGDINFFNTTLATGIYAAGDSRGDVAGNDTTPGFRPSGANGVINAADVDYVSQNFVHDWADLDAATAGGRIRDLSCDMDGDCDVDCDDIEELLVNILDTQVTDLNLDGSTTQADLDVVCDNLGTMNAVWSEGDVNCDGVVDGSDRDIVAVAAGVTGTCP